MYYGEWVEFLPCEVTDQVISQSGRRSVLLQTEDVWTALHDFLLRPLSKLVHLEQEPPFAKTVSGPIIFVFNGRTGIAARLSKSKHI